MGFELGQRVTLNWTPPNIVSCFICSAFRWLMWRGCFRPIHQPRISLKPYAESVFVRLRAAFVADWVLETILLVSLEIRWGQTNTSGISILNYIHYVKIMCNVKKNSDVFMAVDSIICIMCPLCVHHASSSYIMYI